MFIHFLNKTISKKQKAKMLCNIDCKYIYNLEEQKYSYLNKELHYEIDPNFSRKTAELIKIYNNLVEQFDSIVKNSPQDKNSDIPKLYKNEKDKDNILNYLATCTVSQIYLFVIKLYKYIINNESDIKYKEFIFFNFFAEFVGYNQQKITNIFYLLLSCPAYYTYLNIKDDDKIYLEGDIKKKSI